MAISERLMQDFRAGHERAFSDFMDKHLKTLTFYAYGLCKHMEVSEEIVSESFAKLWKGRAGFENESHVRAFLYKVTRNACLDYLKSLQYRNVQQQQELDEGLVSLDSDPLTSLIHAEFIQSLVMAIEKLPRQQAAVFRMTFLEGFTTEEICAQLDSTPNAVFLARKKAISAMRKAFEGRQDLYLLLLIMEQLLVDRLAS